MSRQLLDRPPSVAATRRQFLAVLAGAGVLAGCAATPGTGGAQEVREVTHPLGTSRVPVRPSRVVALDRRSTLPHLLALGLIPVGGLTYRSIIGADFPPELAPQLSDVTVLPAADGPDAPNVEAVAALRPDLILGWTGGIGEAYQQLSAIAPTVAIDVDFTDTAVGLNAVARAVGREAKAAEVITGFERDLAPALAGIRPAGTVSVLLGVGGGEFRLYLPMGSAVCRWIAAAGGRIDPDPAGIAGETYQNLFVTIGPETLGSVTSETILLLTNTGASGEAALAELQGTPLWSGLPAVRAGRVIRLGSQEAAGQYGVQGYRSILSALTRQWRSLG